MKRSAIASALVGATLLPLSAQAITWQGEDYKLSLNGTLHLSVNQDTCEGNFAGACKGPWYSVQSYGPDDVADLRDGKTYVTSNFSYLDLKGMKKLGKGISLIGRSEVFVTEKDRSPDDKVFNEFEQWLGLKGQFGTARYGTIMTPYMLTGNMIRPFRRNSLDSRFLADALSAVHHSTGKGRGRSRDTLVYETPALVDNLTAQVFVGRGTGDNESNSYGGGLIYKTKGLIGFAQYYTNGEDGDDSAFKIGGKYGFAQRHAVYGQYEWDLGLISLAEGVGDFSTRSKPGDLTPANSADNAASGADQLFLGYQYNWGQGLLVAEFGQRDDNDNTAILGGENGHSSWMLGGSYTINKHASVYTGYMQKDYNSDALDNDRRVTVGTTLSF